jgi:hypothetical protein
VAPRTLAGLYIFVKRLLYLPSLHNTHMKIPLPWRRKQTSTILALQNSPPSQQPPQFQPASPRPQTIRTSPRQHLPGPEHTAESSVTYSADSTATDTDFPDLYSSSAYIDLDDELSDSESVPDEYFGAVPCSPRWLPDLAHTNIQQYRATAQMGALAEACGLQPLRRS